MIMLKRVLTEGTAARKLRAGRCITPFCRRQAREDRHYCCTCRDRVWRRNHPLRYLFKNLKGHAKARGITFRLTYDEWVEFCTKTGYHETVGREANSSTVDRIDPRFGYHADNIRCLTHSENSTRQDALPMAAGEPF